jgi:hypothetical protein
VNASASGLEIVRRSWADRLFAARRYGASLVALVAVVSIMLATATVWLLLTQPVRVADAIQQGGVAPLAGELAQAMVGALWGLLRWLT